MKYIFVLFSFVLLMHVVARQEHRFYLEFGFIQFLMVSSAASFTCGGFHCIACALLLLCSTALLYSTLACALLLCLSVLLRSTISSASFICGGFHCIAAALLLLTTLLLYSTMLLLVLCSTALLCSAVYCAQYSALGYCSALLLLPPHTRCCRCCHWVGKGSQGERGGWVKL